MQSLLLLLAFRLVRKDINYTSGKKKQAYKQEQQMVTQLEELIAATTHAYVLVCTCTYVISASEGR